MRPLKAVPNSLVVVLLVVAILGFADASYLTIEHYQNTIPPCGIDGCETVLTSVYSQIAGIPTSLFGAIYYLLIAAGMFSFLEGKRERHVRYALVLTALGFLASLAFVCIMGFVIKAWCLYCLGSAASSTLLFILACVIFVNYGNKNPEAMLGK